MGMAWKHNNERVFIPNQIKNLLRNGILDINLAILKKQKAPPQDPNISIGYNP